MNHGSFAASQTVLVVDDDPDIRSLMRRWLEARGYGVAEAADGRQAVGAALRERPGLILMDLVMPEVDGFASALRIREKEGLRDVPIVGISAYGESGVDVQLQIDPAAVGFNAYVAKPFGPEQLAEILDRFVPKRIVLASGELSEDAGRELASGRRRCPQKEPAWGAKSKAGEASAGRRRDSCETQDFC